MNPNLKEAKEEQGAPAATPHPQPDSDSTWPWQIAIAAFLGVLLVLLVIGFFKARKKA